MATRITGIGEMPMEHPAVDHWFRRLSFHISASKQENLAKAVLLSSCGETAFSLIETLLAPAKLEDDAVTVLIIEEAVRKHFQPKRILHVERHKMHAMVQVGGEIASLFVQKLKDQANKCDYGTLKDDLILTQFIFGLSDRIIREKLLAMDDLNLDKAIQQVLLHETISSASSSMTTVSMVATADVPGVSTYGGCYSCGGKSHRRVDCKYRDVVCRNCNRKGHMSRVCRSAAAAAANQSRKSARQMRHLAEVGAEDSEGSGEVILSITTQQYTSTNKLTSAAKFWYVQCSIGDASARFLVDTGSEVTLVPEKLVAATGYTMSEPLGCHLRAFGGFKPDIKGKLIDANIGIGMVSAVGTVLVSGNDEQPLLGMNFIHSLNLLTGITCSPVVLLKDSDFVASFRLKRNASIDGMKYAARSLPFSMKALVEDELRRLLDADVIYPVDNPRISAPIVPVRKQSGASRPIRICGDYSCTLNKIIDPDAYKIPRIEEILEKIPNAKYYSVLDLEDAYLQIGLTKESQSLTCVSTHMGHFAYRKMQFGISAAPLIFQEVMDRVLKGIPNTAAYQDDIVVGTETDEQHDVCLNLVRQRLATHNFKVNERKSQIKKKTVNFLGFTLCDGKLQPRQDRLDEFRKMSVPTSKDELRSALGALRHYGQFCRNFSSIAQPLYALLKKDVHWSWTSSHTEAYKTLLDKIPEGCIVCYDIKKPLFVTSDASAQGLGYVLSHDRDQREIVWIGSRVLRPAEQSYANVEREALAIVEAVKYFHKFIAGRHFTILSDHRPLQYIFNHKPVSERISTRLQRWAVTLKQYDYSIEYQKGESMYGADMLSRLPVGDSSTSLVPRVNLLELNSLEGFVSGNSLLHRIAKARDSDLDAIKKYIVHGWPAKLRGDLLPYTKDKAEYSIQDGVVYKGIRIVPPMCLKSEILHLLHSDHPGVVRMVRLARQYFWWPSINADINSMVQRCSVCQTNARKRSGMNLASWQEPHEFMERVHVDIAHYKDKRFLVLVDAFSNWTDVLEVKDLSAKATITALRMIFKYVGLPKVVVSDSGTNLVAEETEKWLAENLIKHVRTPPGHHASNGLAERIVQEFKFYMHKMTGVGYDRAVVAFCLQHNTTPAASGSVPADFVFTKKLRTRVSAMSTERVVPFEPFPAYVRVEHRAPAPSEIVARHGENTSFDIKGRLVHDADVVPVESTAPVWDKKPGEKTIELPADNESLIPESASVPDAPRRGTRDRKQTDFYSP